MKRPTSPRAAILLAVVALLGLSGCGSQVVPPSDPTHTSRTRFTPAPAWEPRGMAPAVVLRSPGDGGTRTIKVGDRVRLPDEGFGGLRFQDWSGRLVPYGDRRTYLAVGEGRVTVDETEYDTQRPCVPPQPVATFDLVIVPGTKPDLPAPRRLVPSDEPKVVTVVPGQELTAPTGWRIAVSSRQDSPIYSSNDGVFAARPGTESVTLLRHWPQQPTERPAGVTVRVIDPARDSSSPKTSVDRASALPAGPAGRLAAGPAAAPACG